MMTPEIHLFISNTCFMQVRLRYQWYCGSTRPGWLEHRIASPLTPIAVNICIGVTWRTGPKACCAALARYPANISTGFDQAAWKTSRFLRIGDEAHLSCRKTFESHATSIIHSRNAISYKGILQNATSPSQIYNFGFFSLTVVFLEEMKSTEWCSGLCCDVQGRKFRSLGIKHCYESPNCQRIKVADTYCHYRERQKLS